MNQFGDKLRSPLRFRIPDRSIPIQDRGPIRVGIRVALQVRPVALPDDNVRNAVAIQIRESRCMELGKCHVACVLSRKITHNLVLDERDVAILVSLLLVPSQAPSVSRKRSHHVSQAVAVHVEHTHLRAAATEVDRMKFPRPLGCAF